MFLKPFGYYYVWCFEFQTFPICNAFLTKSFIKITPLLTVFIWNIEADIILYSVR